MPSLAIGFGFLGQKASGAITASDVMGPPRTTTDSRGTGCLVTPPATQQDPNPEPFRSGDLCSGSDSLLVPATASHDTSVAPLVEASFELMGPRLSGKAPFPRLFAHVDVSASFAFERNLAGERKPDDFSSPELAQTRNDIPERAVGGQGSRANSQVGRIVLSAGAGVALSTEIRERRVRFKPSIEYLRQEQRLRGLLHRAVKQRDPANRRGTLEDFRLVRLRATDTVVQHGLGLGFEVEADSGRVGPLGVSLFVLGRGYRFLGELKASLSSRNEFDEEARWDFDFEPWGWRAGAGIRFRWLPE